MPYFRHRAGVMDNNAARWVIQHVESTGQGKPPKAKPCQGRQEKMIIIIVAVLILASPAAPSHS